MPARIRNSGQLAPRRIVERRFIRDGKAQRIALQRRRFRQAGNAAAEAHPPQHATGTRHGRCAPRQLV
jgi:hypothetical protein